MKNLALSAFPVKTAANCRLNVPGRSERADVLERFARMIGFARIPVLLAMCIASLFGCFAVAECSEKRIHEIVIEHQWQKNIADSAQTVLDMLGYEGHRMFPYAKVKVDNMRSMPGTREFAFESGHEEEIDCNYPKVWFVQGKGIIAGKLHWVICHKGDIYSPTLGQMSVDKFKRESVVSVLYIFEIPVLEQMNSEQYYQQVPEEMTKRYNAAMVIKNNIFSPKKRVRLGNKYEFPDVETDLPRN